MASRDIPPFADIRGEVVIGEGIKDNAPGIFVGEHLGTWRDGSPRFNIAPQSAVPVVYETKDGERIAETMRWGLVPHWAKDPSLGAKLNNARSEGLADKPSFRQAVRRRREPAP